MSRSVFLETLNQFPKKLEKAVMQALVAPRIARTTVDLHARGSVYGDSAAAFRGVYRVGGNHYIETIDYSTDPVEPSDCWREV